MGEIELLAERWVPARGAPERMAPWLEVTARLRVEVAAWDHRERAWIYRAFPARGGAVDLSAGRLTCRDRRAALAGQPPEALRDGSLVLATETVAGALAAVLASLPEHLLRHRELAVVSGLGEAEADFRRRCLDPMGAAMRAGELPAERAVALHERLRGGFERRSLGAAELVVERARAGVCWYPVGDGPQQAGADLMIHERRRG